GWHQAHARHVRYAHWCLCALHPHGDARRQSMIRLNHTSFRIALSIGVVCATFIDRFQFVAADSCGCSDTAIVEAYPAMTAEPAITAEPAMTPVPFNELTALQSAEPLNIGVPMNIAQPENIGYPVSV